MEETTETEDMYNGYDFPLLNPETGRTVVGDKLVDLTNSFGNTLLDFMHNCPKAAQEIHMSPSLSGFTYIFIAIASCLICIWGCLFFVFSATIRVYLILEYILLGLTVVPIWVMILWFREPFIQRQQESEESDVHQ